MCSQKPLQAAVLDMAVLTPSMLGTATLMTTHASFHDSFHYSFTVVSHDSNTDCNKLIPGQLTMFLGSLVCHCGTVDSRGTPEPYA